MAVLLGLVCLLSCEKSDDSLNNTCEVIDPIEELIWLKDAIEEIKDDRYAYYRMGQLDNETVFFYDNCNPLINFASILVDCEGDRIGLSLDFKDEITDVVLLWKHEENECNL